MTMLQIPPSVARKALGNLFTEQPVMLANINDMHDSLAVVFYAFCRGDSLKPAGNNIDADYEVLCLPAAVNELENKYLIPVQHCSISTSSVIAGGKKTTQMSYVMDENVVAQLQVDPEAVFREQEKYRAVRKWERKQKQIEKMIKSHGGLHGALMMLTRSGHRDKVFSDDELTELEEKFRDILSKLDSVS